MSDRLTIELTMQEVEKISEDSDMVCVKMLVDRGVVGYVPRRKHIAKQLLLTMQREERLLTLLQNVLDQNGECGGNLYDAIYAELHPSEYRDTKEGK